VLALPATVIAWAFPRASRVAIYQGELSNPATLAAVSGVFTNQPPRTDEPEFLVDLGYATIRLDEKPTAVFQPRPGLIEIRLDRGRIVAFAPFRWRDRNGVWDPVIGVVGAGDDPALDPFSGMRKDFNLGPNFEGSAGFEWNASAVRATPMTAPMIWSMPGDAFGRLYLRTLFKAMESLNQGGGWVLRAEWSRSIIRFGSSSLPGRVHIATWSRPGDLTQGLLVDSDSADWSRQTARTIASSWTPMIEQAPSDWRELERMISRNIAGGVNTAGD